MLPLNNDFMDERYGLHFRFVNEEDAEFIVQLRTDPKLGQYINSTKPDIEEQRLWLRKYKERQEAGLDFYFMFEKPVGVKLGVCRIYDVSENNFTIGSWVFSPKAPIGSAILADIITREVAYELFSSKQHLFDVKKKNINVNRYHDAYKSEIIAQNEDTNYYTCSQGNFEKYKKNYIRMFVKK